MPAPNRWKVDALFARYNALLLRRAKSLLGNNEAAKDVTQEVFLRILVDGKVLREPEPLGWLLKVTTNLCLNRLRDDQRRTRLLARNLPANDVDSGCAETRTLLANILRRVPSDLREIALYHHVVELSCREIATLVGVSRRTIGNRLVAFRVAVRSGERTAKDVGRRRTRGEGPTPASKAAQRVAIAAVGKHCAL